MAEPVPGLGEKLPHAVHEPVHLTVGAKENPPQDKAKAPFRMADTISQPQG